MSVRGAVINGYHALFLDQPGVLNVKAVTGISLLNIKGDEMKFYLMGNGRYIVEANRGTNKKAIVELQKQEWTRRQGGICKIVELTDDRAIYFAIKG